jgi:hypothetical protein
MSTVMLLRTRCVEGFKGRDRSRTEERITPEGARMRGFLLEVIFSEVIFLETGRITGCDRAT